MKPKLTTRFRNQKLKNGAPQRIQPKQWIADYSEVAATKTRSRLMTYTLVLLNVTLVASLMGLALQGFKAWGFCLPREAITWLARSVFAQVGALSWIAIHLRLKPA
jgi:hypothetical protein